MFCPYLSFLAHSTTQHQNFLTSCLNPLCKYTSGIKQVNISEEKISLSLSLSQLLLQRNNNNNNVHSILQRKKVADLIRGQLEETTTTTTTSIPFMITQAMKVELGSLGYSEEEIRNMTPSDAHTFLTAGQEKE